MIAAHPGIEPGATPFVVGVALLLSSRTASSLKNKNTWIMIMQVPAEGVEPSQGHAGRG